MACIAFFLWPTGYFSIFFCTGNCTGNNTGVYLTSAWKKLPVPLCSHSYEQPQQPVATLASAAMSACPGKAEGQVHVMPLPMRGCSNYCDHCCRCRGFLFCTLFCTTSRIGIASCGPSQCSLPHVPRSRPQTGSCLPFSPCSPPAGQRTARALALRRAGAAREPRPRGCSERSGPTRAAEHCARSGLSPRWPRAADKRDPDSGFFTGRGVRDCCLGRSEDAAEKVRHTACLGKEGPISWDQGSPQACPGADTSDHGSGAVPQVDAKGMDLEIPSITRLCPRPGVSWSTSGSALRLVITHCAEICPGKHLPGKEICFGGFLCMCMPGLCTWLSQCLLSITCISDGSEKPECRFQCI